MYVILAQNPENPVRRNAVAVMFAIPTTRILTQILPTNMIATEKKSPTRFTSDALLVSVGPYNSIAEYKLHATPADVPVLWRDLMRTKQFKWFGKCLAHIFEGGWADAPFKGASEDHQ